MAEDVANRNEAGALIRPAYYSDRYGDNCESLSVDYRKYEELILSGGIPKKYRRLLPHIPGDSVLEVGSGEGVLSLALAAHKQSVIALDLTPSRHAKGLEIQSRWRTEGIDVDRCQLILGDVFENKPLLKGIDTVIACRVIYYFRERIDEFMSLMSSNVRFLCLIGNKRRNRRRERIGHSRDIGECDYYSTLEGMREVLERFGFTPIYTDLKYDPVVIGELRRE